MKPSSYLTTPFGMISTVLIVTILWGSPFPFIKKSYEALHIASSAYGEQILFAGYRFFLASIVLFIIMLITKRELIPRQRSSLIPIVNIGFVLTFLQYVAVYIGLSLSSGITTSIIIGSTPFLQILIAHFMIRGDQLTFHKITAVVIGFIGICLLQFHHQTFTLQIRWGEIIVFIGALASAFGNNLVKQTANHIDIFQLTTYQMLLGSLCLIALGARQVGFFPFDFDWISLSMLFFLVFISAFAFLLWNSLLKVHQLSKISIYLCFIPLIGVIFSAVLLHESLYLNHLFSLLMVVISIYIMNRSPVKDPKRKKVRHDDG